jgi:site-specific DNA-methyltransferase (adenine-specific)
MTYDIVNADCTKWLPQQASFGTQVDCCICDPPYHLASIAKRFGGANAAPAQHGKDGAAARLSRGFMGSSTDSGEIAFQPETWRAVLSVMKPGARMACFGGTRTWWKLAAAIDAAGFEIEDTIMWVYGQGLVLRTSRLKPNWEPILLCRAPNGGSPPLNIDACRIPRGSDDIGGWPGNLIHDGSADVLAELPDTVGQLADARSDGTAKGNKVYGAMRHRQGEASAERSYAAAKPGARRSDSGSAARFFTQCGFSEEEEERRLIYCPKATASERICLCEACGEQFRGNMRAGHAHGLEGWEHIKGHPTVKPQSLLRHLVRLLAPPGGLVLDPFCGTATTCEAAHLEGRDAIGIELDETHAASGVTRMRTIRQKA